MNLQTTEGVRTRCGCRPILNT